MTTLDDIVHGEQGRGSTPSSPWVQPWSGVIVNNPAAVSGDLYVHLPGIDPDRQFGPCGWDPVPTTEGKFYIPGGGEECAVQFDDDRIPWLSAWTPDSGSVKLGGVIVPSLAALEAKVAALEAKLPTLVSALPAEPFDGQVINYLADATNGIVWQLRYRAASASAHKWEYVGGQPLHAAANVGAEIEVAPPSKAIKLPSSPTLTIPFAGDYRINVNASSVYRAKAGAQTSIIAVNSSTVAELPRAEENNLAVVGAAAGQTNEAALSGDITSAGLAEGLVVAVGAFVVLGAEAHKAQYFAMSLKITPIRVG